MSQEYVIAGVDDGKGSLKGGSDADLTLVDLDSGFTLRAEDLLYRHKISPFISRPCRGSVVRTLVHGTTVVRHSRRGVF